MHVRLYDLPIYRLSRKKYDQDMQARLKRAVEPWRQATGNEPPREVVDWTSQRQHEAFGPWEFNEIIGYIRIYVLGSQVRGEHFSAEKARNPLGRRRVFVLKSLKLASEVEIGDFGRAFSSNDVWEAIQKYIVRCQKELRNGRLIDDKLLRAIGPHTDWIAVINNATSGQN
jgi:hypothetical protein